MNNIEFIQASLELLNAVPLNKKENTINKHMLKYGYIVPDNITDAVEKVLINMAVLTHNAFYSSWNDVISKCREDLVIEQIFHYLTVTIKDVFNEDLVFIPNNFGKEVTAPLKVIKGLLISEIKTQVMEIIYRKVALKEETIKKVFIIIDPYEVDILKVQNRDSRTYIQVKFSIIPKDALDILKCAVYDLTGDLNIIKNKELYSKITCQNPGRDGNVLIKWLNGNEAVLATIFNRFKPIFMCMKCFENVKPYVNKISKLSKKHHVPLTLPKKEPTTGYEVVKHLHYLLNNKTPKIYQIRNGKMWCTRDRKEEIEKYEKKLKELLPSNFIQSPGTRLSLPTSEKNFIGAFPMGTLFTDKSLIIGIFWRNQDGKRIDLDLSAFDLKGKIGWNDNYYSEDRQVIFSGDVIDAPNGANEYLYFKNISCPQVVMVNKYSPRGNDVKMDIIISSAENDTVSNEIIEDSKIIATINTSCGDKQKTLGVVYPTENGPSFVLIDKYLGKDSTISSRNADSDIMIDAFVNNYLYMDQYSNQQTFNTLDLSNKIISKKIMLDIFNK
jgi:hypothetical protein